MEQPDDQSPALCGGFLELSAAAVAPQQCHGVERRVHHPTNCKWVGLWSVRAATATATTAGHAAARVRVRRWFRRSPAEPNGSKSLCSELCPHYSGTSGIPLQMTVPNCSFLTSILVSHRGSTVLCVIGGDWVFSPDRCLD